MLLATIDPDKMRPCEALEARSFNVALVGPDADEPLSLR
jgi:hypothetical protein